MKAVASADLKWGIGCGGQLLQRIPGDMKFFRGMTTGKVVVMGRETFESLPGRQPLKDRVNIVLSRNADYDDDRLIICRSLDELFDGLAKYDTDDVFVIGGESVYTQLLPYCSEVYVTRFEKVFDADRHFPNLDTMANWLLVWKGGRHFYNGMGYRFLKYINRSVRDYR
jgi:dihydrofolate reductase